MIKSKLSVSILSILFSVTLLMPLTVHAAFLSNNLIDDVIFNNSNSMNANQINSWLNSFPSSCISSNNGFSAADPTGYNSTQGFLYGGPVTAGQVIYDAAQAYNINPQVLLSTLQKEEGLVRGDGPYGCSALAISASVGYACPDGGSSYSYSGLNPALYYTNGTPVSSVSGTCVNNAKAVGFSQQIIRAAWLLKFGEQRSEGNTGWEIIKGNWVNSDDPSTCYEGPMTQGNFKRCSTDTNTVYYDGYTVIDGTSTHMDDGATAALYWYTPHFSGNKSFDNIFSTWFGPLYANCFVPSMNNQAFRLYNPSKGDYLYTVDSDEACIAESFSGYYGDDLSFTTVPSANGGVPLYRLSNSANQHFYTINSTEMNNAEANGYTYEGVSFDVQPSATTGYVPVYRLYEPNGSHYYTSSSAEKDYDVSNLGYSYEGIAFYTASNSNSDVPIYRLKSPSGNHFYTSSSAEASSAEANYGYTSEGIAFYGQTAYNDSVIPVYRLFNPNTKNHMFTSSSSERIALLRNGYSNEGVAFYIPTTTITGTLPVYRLYAPNSGDHLYTTSQNEENAALRSYGYTYEGVPYNGFGN